MRLSEFKLDVPEDSIAQKPSATNRDEAKLMVLHKDTGEIEHKLFKNIIEYFGKGDVMIVNNAKVFPARMYGKKEKTGAKIEVFLLRELNSEKQYWDVLVDPARKIRVGNKLYFTDQEGKLELVAEVTDNTTSRGRTIRFSNTESSAETKKLIEKLGTTPLPKYIKRKADLVEEGVKVVDDKNRYQTIFAPEDGMGAAIAAPTAGLHFSTALYRRMELKGIEFAEITLDVGAGTFRSIDVEDLTKHKMDSERYKILPADAAIVNKGIDNKKKICAVGTTSMRAIESAVSTDSRLNSAPSEKEKKKAEEKGEKLEYNWTNKFIYPSYDFSIANCMITNFHIPKSPLHLMVSAFANPNLKKGTELKDLELKDPALQKEPEHKGTALIKKAYEEAIKTGYKFYSYGDAMLII